MNYIFTLKFVNVYDCCALRLLKALRNTREMGVSESGDNSRMSIWRNIGERDGPSGKSQRGKEAEGLGPCSEGLLGIFHRVSGAACRSQEAVGSRGRGRCGCS